MTVRHRPPVTRFHPFVVKSFQLVTKPDILRSHIARGGVAKLELMIAGRYLQRLWQTRCGGGEIAVGLILPVFVNPSLIA